MSMTALYELGILGNPPPEVLVEIKAELTLRLKELSLDGPDAVTIYAGSAVGFKPSGSRCCAALCFESVAGDNPYLQTLVRKGVPIVPVAKLKENFCKEIPTAILALNGLALDENKVPELVFALLECAGLLPRQRRVFISYRRDQATDAALQLYAAFSARGFEVFLDTHKIHPGEYFQEVLWQRLCDCDVLLMLDTMDYFDSRWTNAEFGRAMARGLALVRVGWPAIALNPRARAAVNLELDDGDFNAGGNLLGDPALKRICESVEGARTKSVAMRYQALVDTLQDRVTKIGGTLDGVSLRRSIIVTLADGNTVAVYPTIGVPTTYALHNATMDNHPPPVAVIYDDGGLDERHWREHMDWLDPHLRHLVRLVPSYRAGWDFAGWHTP